MNATAFHRILFVTPVSPFSSVSGAEQRSTLILSALSLMGQVDVLQLKSSGATRVSAENKEGHPYILADVKESGLALSRYQPKQDLTCLIEQILGHKLATYQLIVGRYVWPVCQLAVPPEVPVLADLDDFHYRYSSLSPWSWATVKERLVKAVTHRLVCGQLNRFSGVFAVSVQDQQEIAENHCLPHALLPNVPFSFTATPTPVPASKTILFVGSLWYRANAEGVNWFLKHVWSSVHAAEPTASLILAGAAPVHVRAIWARHPGVSAPGFVNNLADTYQNARLVIVPLHSGGGTNIKVLEALAHARPCLVTDFVAKAFHGQLSHGREFLVAQNSAEFASKIQAALGTQINLQMIANAGYAAVGQFFTHARFESSVQDFVKTRLLAKANVGSAQ